MAAAFASAWNTETSGPTVPMFTAVRALVDPTDSDDVKRVHALQDATTVEQTDSGSQRRLRPS
jgi:hypothetical protein